MRDNYEGRFFEIAVDNGHGGIVNVVMECTEHTADRYIFETKDRSAWIEIDWMEFLDQKALGRIKLISGQEV